MTVFSNNHVAKGAMASLHQPRSLRVGAGTSVGGTAAADMCKVAEEKSTSLNAGLLVSMVSRLACRDTGATAPIVQIVESLVWPFVARRAHERSVPFDDKEFGRFVKSIRLTARRLVQISSEDNREQSFCKYWLDYYLFSVFRSTFHPPVREEWITEPLFSGWTRRFIARAIARRDVSFIYSLQKGSKQAWPELGQIKKDAALKKHRERLSTYRGTISDNLAEMVTFTSNEIFRPLVGDNQRDRMIPATKFIPSGSACLQAPRSKGGALGLFSQFTIPGSADDAKVIGRLPVLNAQLNQWRSEQCEDAEFAGWSRVSLPVDSQIRLSFVKDLQLKYKSRGLEIPLWLRKSSRFKKLEDGSKRTYTTHGLDVDVVAIPEPSKFRIITKGDGFLYTALQPIQGQMLSCWKSHWSSTMLSPDLTEKVNQIDEAVDAEYWCSVDYEAATDLLKRSATLCAYGRLRYRTHFGALGYVSLFPGVVRYGDGGEAVHVDGQLMGHPLSFPLLCVINLSVYRYALEKWCNEDRRGRQKLMDRMWANVLVNGDDMLFKCPESFYGVFEEVAKDAGFKFSAGKNYLSRDCCMINSQLFIRKGGKMVRKGYLNQRIITGNNIKTGDSECTPTQIGRELNAMISFCPWAKSAVPTTFKRWGADWFGPCYRPNWYLPVHLGGFGVDRKYAPESWRITRDQRIVAAHFVADPRLALYRRDGMTIPTAGLAGAVAKWRWVPKIGPLQDGLSREESDAWLQRLALAARAHQVGTSDWGDAPDRAFVHRFYKKDLRLQPMRDNAFELYWDSSLVAAATPSCPPLSVLVPRVRGPGGGVTHFLLEQIRKGGGFPTTSN